MMKPLRKALSLLVSLALVLTLVPVGAGATGNRSMNKSYGVYCSYESSLTIAGGSLTATGGTAGGKSRGIYCHGQRLSVSSGSLTAIGGTASNSTATSYGIEGRSSSATAISVTGGKLVAQGETKAILDTGFPTDGLTVWAGDSEADKAVVTGNAWLDAKYVMADGGSAPTRVSTWGDLRKALKADGDVILEADVTPENPFWAEALSVPLGVTVTLDLNGHIVDRGYREQGFDGSVLKIQGGALTLIDSAPTAAHDTPVTYTDPLTGETVTVSGGVLTGGWPDQYGGGVQLTSGTFTMEGGSIAGNSVGKTGFFGSAGLGGGLYVQSGTFTMTGGAICGNRATGTSVGTTLGRGGGVYMTSGTFDFSGGAITGNEAGLYGGGVYIASTYSGHSATVNISGGATVTGNAVGDTANNVYLEEGGALTVTGELTGTVGVTMQEPGVFTSGLSGNGTAENFTSDNNTCFVTIQEGGTEAFLKPATHVTTWSELQRALLTSGVVILNYDVTWQPGENDLYVPEGVTAVLDLNGHKVDRAATTTAGTFIEVASSLTLRDSSAEKTGMLTGSDRPSPGGCVKVNNGGSFTMTGGTITGNKAIGEGGGVLVVSGGSFTMTGGNITGNTAQIDDGIAEGGGVCVWRGGSFTMTGGSITGNHAQGRQGAKGGGVFVKGTFNVSGNPTISENTAGSNNAASNVFLATDNDVQVVMAISGTLNITEPIGVTMETPGVFTTGGAFADNDAARVVFVSNDSTYAIVENNKEAMLVPLVTLTFATEHGTTPEAQTLISGEKATEPDAPAAEGWVFGGWYNGDTQWDFADAVTETMVLTAKWTAPSPTTTYYLPTYPPEIVPAEHGTLLVEPVDPQEGATVTVTAQPEEWYRLTALTAVDESGREVPLAFQPDGSYTFTQPAGTVALGGGLRDDPRPAGWPGRLAPGPERDHHPGAGSRHGGLV